MKAREMAPAAPKVTEEIALRENLTPFAESLAAALEPTPANDQGIQVRIITATEAAKALPRICDRQGLTGKPFTYLRQADGRLTSSWVEAPTIWVGKWASREGAIVLKEDAAGPLELRFLTRLAGDAVQDVMRIGNAEQASRELLRAYWDVGIREIRAEVRTELGDVIMTPERQARLAAIPEFEMTRRDRGDGWIEQISRMTARP